MAHLITISAPSGTGKSTITEQLMQNDELRLAFSISATSREPRGEEQHGNEYYFLSTDEFEQKIKDNAFIEYVEVYSGKYYGTLKSEISRLDQADKNIIFDIDAVGALKLKEQYPDETLAIFVSPPSIEELSERLIKRGTDTPEVIDERIARAEFELSLASQFDFQTVNDQLDVCVDEITKAIDQFVNHK